MLTGSEKRELRARAHALQPVVQTGGRGLTEAVMAEVDLALTAHELIKVRLAGMERDDRKLAAEAILKATKAELVGAIGGIVILYRKRPEIPAAAPRSAPAKAPAGRGRSSQSRPSGSERGARSGERGARSGAPAGRGGRSGPASGGGRSRGPRD